MDTTYSKYTNKRSVSETPSNQLEASIDRYLTTARSKPPSLQCESMKGEIFVGKLRIVRCDIRSVIGNDAT